MSLSSLLYEGTYEGAFRNGTAQGDEDFRRAPPRVGEQQRDAEFHRASTPDARMDEQRPAAADPLQFLGRPRVLSRSVSVASECSAAPPPSRAREQNFGRVGAENEADGGLVRSHSVASSVGGGGGYASKAAPADHQQQQSAERAPFSSSNTNAGETAGGGGSRGGRTVRRNPGTPPADPQPGQGRRRA